ncbi:hypothetical protein ACJWDR_37705 [Streptomyces tauricus]|uniref:hypothetical protein n=1 Tax=Streptomyces tauricus TaxID=68274 RepID=UPI00387F0EA5
MNQPDPTTDRRDRYAAAMAKRDGDTWPTEYENDEADYRRRADAAMAVADAEQAELRRVADGLERDAAAPGVAEIVRPALRDAARQIRAALAVPAAEEQPENETPDFVTRVLELFSASHADAYGDLFWTVDNGAVRLHANVSDVFAWGGSDCEPITPDTLPALERAYADLKAVGAEEFTAELYAARQRGMRPQGAAYPSKTHESWRQVSALYDACGPERELGLGNPKAPPTAAAPPAVVPQPEEAMAPETVCVCSHTRREHVTVSGRLLCDTCDPDSTDNLVCRGFDAL